ncbi:solute carrier family 22 member 4-like isoform X3 [Heterodontus francisci]|uniref:solute carrier family 22 member 4-like isoform X3 n=1 Tax=Heterodontus francisci TaxID=7792 RepID=UPI00355C0512
MQDYDEATSFLGQWGCYQRTIFFLLSIGLIPNGYVGLCMVFLADTPQHHCRLSNSSNMTIEETSFTNLSLLLPMETVEGEQVYSKCTRFKTQVQDGFNDTIRETEHCVDGWVYSKDRYISTIVSEWDLVCENGWKGPMATSVVYFGMTSGAFISGHISDRYGRKNVLYGAMIIQITLSFIQTTSWSWELFCTLCFFIGFGDMSNFVAAFVLGTEVLGKTTRTTYATLGVCMFYAIGYIILPFFAYHIRNWRMLLFALTLPEILYIPSWWLIPESPRWLIAQGRMTEAEKIVQGFAKKNGISHTGMIFQNVNVKEHTLLNTGSSEKHPYSFLDLVRTSNMRNITILNLLIWTITSIGYFVLTLGTSNMHGDPYLNCFISALSEIVAYTVAWLMVSNAPRRISAASMLLLGGAILLFIQFIPSTFHLLTTVLVMIGKSGITIAFAIIYVFSAELYPTVVRNMGIGMCSMSSRLGSIISPYFVYLGAYNRMLTFLLIGSFTLLAGILCLLLPETRGHPLPENLQQVQPIRWLCCSIAPQHSAPNSPKTPRSQEMQVQNSDVFFPASRTEPNFDITSTATHHVQV